MRPGTGLPTAARGQARDLGPTALVAVAVAGFILSVQLLDTGPALLVDDAGTVLAAVAAAVCCGLTARRLPRGSRTGWAILAAATGCYAVGESVWGTYEVVLRREVPFPGIADLFYLAGAVLAVAGLIMLVGRGARPQRRAARLLDGVITVGGVVAVSWATVLGPIYRDDNEGPLSLLVSLAYPVADLVVVALVLLALPGITRRQRAPLLLLGAGLLTTAFSDSLFAYLTTSGNFQSGGLLDAGWFVGYLLVALAGLAQLRQTNPAPGAAAGADMLPLPTWGQPSRVGMALPYLPLVLAAALSAQQVRAGGRVDRAEIALVVALAVLVLVRQFLVLSENVQLVAALTTSQDQLRHQAFHDLLTGLANRALFADRLAHAFDLTARADRSLAVLLVDLDGFKAVNDNLGHPAGDTVLVAVAERLRGCIRAADTLARLGGDEFALLVEDGGEPDLLGTRIVAAVQAPFLVDGTAVRIGASVGLAIHAPGRVADLTPEVLLRQADAALYLAKSRGKACVVRYEPGMVGEGTDLALLGELAGALDDGQVRVVYQPVVELDSGLVVSVEALARWTSPTRGPVPPDVFIPAAEHGGLSARLDDYILEQALSDLSGWPSDRDGRRPQMAVNVSAVQLSDAGLPARIGAALRRHGIDPYQLVIEVTETALVADLDRAADVLAGVKALGLRIAVDDFGTGWSSLLHLHRFPADVVKIDRAFTGRLGADPRATRLVEGVLGLAAGLGLVTVAEGVESTDQLAVLQSLGCPLAQGWLFSRALAAADVPAVLAGRLPFTVTAGVA